MASCRSVPMRACHARRNVGSSRSPAANPWRKFAISCQDARSRRRKTPGAAASRAAPWRKASCGICSIAVPWAGMIAVAPTVHGSSRLVPRVNLQLKAPACSIRSVGFRSYQPWNIMRRAEMRDGMHHGARPARTVRGEDDIGQPVRITLHEIGGWQVGHGGQLRLGQDGRRVVGKGDLGTGHRRADLRGHAGDFGTAQLGRCRHRDDARRDRP